MSHESNYVVVEGRRFPKIPFHHQREDTPTSVPIGTEPLSTRLRPPPMAPPPSPRADRRHRERGSHQEDPEPEQDRKRSRPEPDADEICDFIEQAAISALSQSFGRPVRIEVPLDGIDGDDELSLTIEPPERISSRDPSMFALGQVLGREKTEGEVLPLAPLHVPVPPEAEAGDLGTSSRPASSFDTPGQEVRDSADQGN